MVSIMVEEHDEAGMTIASMVMSVRGKRKKMK